MIESLAPANIRAISGYRYLGLVAALFLAAARVFAAESVSNYDHEAALMNFFAKGERYEASVPDTLGTCT